MGKRRHLSINAFLLLLVSALSGCDDGEGPPCSPPCSFGFVCDGDGACVPSHSVGASCGSSDDCEDGVCFSGASFPGGYCSEMCGGQVNPRNDLCPTGSLCVQLGEAVSACMDECDGTSGSCRQGYMCKPMGGGSVCFPGCQSDGDCTYQMGCNRETGYCEPKGSDGRVGGPCQNNEMCTEGGLSGICLQGDLFPEGYCTRTCTPEQEGMRCEGDDGLCMGLSQSDGSQVYACFAECTVSVNCRAGYICSADAGVLTDGGNGLCFPRCEHTDCRSGWTCDTTSGFCVDGAPPTTEQVEIVPLGRITVGPRTFPEVTINVPASAISFSLVTSPITAGSTVAPVEVRAPNGQLLYDHANPMTTDYRPNSLSLVSSSQLYPNAPRLSLVEGAYRVSIGSTVEQTIDVTAVLNHGSAVAQRGSLPINLWFTRQNRLNAQTAQTDPVFQRALSIVSEIYGNVGITIGPVRYHDMAEPQGTALAVVDDWDEFVALFASQVDSQEEGLNFFLVDSFTLEGAEGLLGLSDGIPGPVGVASLPRSGVAVALAYLQDTDMFAETLAHEAAHFLGLFHTTERDGTSYDPLLDTVQCPASHDQNGDGLVDSVECSGLGDTNLMFWASGSRPQRTLTNDQRWVLFRNPMVQQ